MIPEVKFKILYGFGTEFLNYIVNQGYYIHGIETVPFGFTAWCSADEYRMIARSAKKFQCRTRVVVKKGVYFRIRKYLSRKGLIVGVFLFPVWCFVFSKMIWKININTTDEALKNEVAGFLFDNQVYTGVFYPREKMDSLKREIMVENEKISYIAFNFYKGVLECEVYTATSKNDYDVNKTGQNIYAQLSGVITDLRVYSGFSQVSLGESVSAGDTLVSNVSVNKFGFVSSSDTSAYIEGICKKEYIVYVPFEKNADVYTGRQKDFLSVYFMGKEYPVYNTDEELWEKYTERTVVKYGDFFGFHMPLTIKNRTFYQLENIHISGNMVDVQSIAKMQLIHLAENDIKLKKELSRRYDYTVTDSGIIAKCSVEGYYDMT